MAFVGSGSIDTLEYVCVCVCVCVCVQVTSYLLLLGFYALPNKKIYIPLQFWAGDDSWASQHLIKENKALCYYLSFHCLG